MNKSILIIDTPNKCRECGFYYKDNRMSCYIDDYIKDCKGICPLKPMPKKKIHIAKYNIWKECSKEDKEIMLENKGWNACIDEILGGK